MLGYSVDSDVKFAMLSMRVLLFLAALDLCIALPSDTILVRQDVNCQNATAHEPTCWANLGYDDWFDTWQGPCPGPTGCSCDVRKPWSDCLLKQYQTAAGDPAGSTISCTDLTRPDLCSIPPSDWTKLSENELAAAYVSTAIGSKLSPKKNASYHFGQLARSLYSF